MQYAYFVILNQFTSTFTVIEVTVGLNRQEYYATEGQTVIIAVEASKAAGRFYEIYVNIPENNITSKSMNYYGF